MPMNFYVSSAFVVGGSCGYEKKTWTLSVTGAEGALERGLGGWEFLFSRLYGLKFLYFYDWDSSMNLQYIYFVKVSTVSTFSFMKK